MCAVRFIHLGNGIDDLKDYEIVEDSYSPETEIKGLSKDAFAKAAILKDIAIVCSLNNESGLVFDGK
jgi:hypothetical protein